MILGIPLIALVVLPFVQPQLVAAQCVIVSSTF